MKVEQSLFPKQNYPTTYRTKENILPTNTINTNFEQGTANVNTNEEIVINEEELDSKVSSLNKFLEASSSKVKFEYHEQLGEYFVQLVDTNTNEVVKEIPPKKILDMYAEMLEIMGLFVDRKI